MVKTLSISSGLLILGSGHQAHRTIRLLTTPLQEGDSRHLSTPENRVGSLGKDAINPSRSKANREAADRAALGHFCSCLGCIFLGKYQEAGVKHFLIFVLLSPWPWPGPGQFFPDFCRRPAPGVVGRRLRRQLSEQWR